MCELTVYILKNGSREKVMEGVVRLAQQDQQVQLEGIFGESKTITGRLDDVDIIAQTANIVIN